MNAYSVVSETLTSRPGWSGIEPPLEPPEDYAIAHVVVAGSRAQAKWLAWKTDKDSFENDAREMPKFSVRKLRGGVEGPARIATDEPEYQELWAKADCSTPAYLREEVARLTKERDALLRTIVRPWTRDDGAKLFKVNLAWFDTTATEEEAYAMVGRIAKLDDPLRPPAES